MSLLTRKIESVRTRISSIGSVDILNDDCRSSDVNSFQDLRDLPLILPDNLEEVLYKDVSSVVFSWKADISKFSGSCKRGFLNLLSPRESIEQLNIQIAEAEEAKRNCLEDDQGYLAVINDWPHWFPLFRFRSGDMFCIETRKDGFPIVFLEHDVMDSGPNLHGMQLAKNVECLVNDWASILFVELIDWMEVCNQDGIDLSNAILEKLQNA